MRNQHYTYLLLSEGASAEAVTAKMNPVLVSRSENEDPEYGAFLQPVTSIHLHSDLFREMSANGNATYVYLFAIIAFY